MNRTNICLEPRQTEALDELARQGDIAGAGAGVVRRLIDEGLAQRRGRLERDLQSIRESFGALADDSAGTAGTDALIAHVRGLPAACEVAERAGQYQRTYRRSHSGTSLGNHLVAANAAASGEALATLDVRHFRMFPDMAPPFPAGG